MLLLEAVTSVRYKAALSVAYGAAARFEIISLKVRMSTASAFCVCLLWF